MSEPDIDPIELFDFLAEVGARDYPTNGFTLSRRAMAAGYSPRLIGFFEALPGTFGSEADIVSHAPIQAPPDSSAAPPDELTVTDITTGDNPSN